MIPLNPWEHQNAIKALYSKCVEGVCVKHSITRMELDILLFLANNPCFDTATDIIEVRYLSKSQVSSSIKLLEQRGYLRKEYLECNRKTAHLKICEGAMDIIHDGQAAQEKFVSIMLEGFSQEEVDSMKKHNGHIMRNINAYLKEEQNNV
ncbi:MAG: MarR family transcriptional regulator [Lachnospiraceae bacterium]|nr:MarR family transcriptional regulator [Lachnospiraceae bacterium]